MDLYTSPFSKGDVVALWADYHRTRSVRDRNRIVEAYMPLVELNVSKVKRRLPDAFDPDDLIGAAAAGLMEAIANFDPSRRIKFTTFAAQRVRGAIMDELRRLDPINRYVRTKMKHIEHVTMQLTDELGRRPTLEEVAGKLNIMPARLMEMLREHSASEHASLDDCLLSDSGNRETPIAALVVDTREVNPLEAVEQQDLVRHIIAVLPPHYSVFVVSYYIEDQTMKTIARRLDYSESRVSQLIARALRFARSLYAEAA